GQNRTTAFSKELASVEVQLQSDVATVKIVGLTAAVFEQPHDLCLVCYVEGNVWAETDVGLIKCRWYEHSIVGSATGFDGNANRNFARLRVRNPCPKRCSDMIAGINEKHPAESVEDEIARCQRIVFCNVRFD